MQRREQHGGRNICVTRNEGVVLPYPHLSMPYVTHNLSQQTPQRLETGKPIFVDIISGAIGTVRNVSDRTVASSERNPSHRDEEETG